MTHDQLFFNMSHFLYFHHNSKLWLPQISLLSWLLIIYTFIQRALFTLLHMFSISYSYSQKQQQTHSLAIL